MPDFSNLQKYHVAPEATSVYKLTQLEGNMSLTVVPTTDANKGYLNAVLQRNQDNARAVQAGGMSIEMMEATREDDKVLYAQHAVKDSHLVDAKGKPVPHSVDNILDFFQKIPNWIFDDIRMYCGQPRNFLDQPDPGITAKN